MKNEPLICLPGQRLSICDETFRPGQGSYQRQGYIYSMLAGTVDIVDKNGVKVIEVHSAGEETVIPSQGDVVTAQIYIINQQYARCWIKCIGYSVLRSPFKAVIRRENIRATEKDKIEVFKSFRPGDIVLARVLPITEAHSYQLTTAENELGVVIAHSEAGHLMVPVSWVEMQCPKTLIKESRKVAKIIPENIDMEKMSIDDD